MSVNKEALRETLAAVKANPDHWHQLQWITQRPGCGTAYCFAGWRAALDGYTEESRRWCCAVDPTTGRSVSIPDYAEECLGLTSEQADELFHPFNTLADLERIVAELCEDAP